MNYGQIPDVRYYNNYPAGGYYIPPDTPSPAEKAAVRRNYSKTALILIAFELLTLAFATIMELMISLSGTEVYTYTAEGELRFTVGLEVCGFYSVIIANLCVSAFYFLRSDRPFGELFNTSEITPKKIGATIIIALGTANFAYFLYILIDVVLTALGLEVSVANITEPLDDATYILDLISSVIFAPIFEEILYRGIVMTNLCRVSKRFAIVVSALVFGLAHGNIYQFTLAFMVGTVFAYADISMKSLIPSILAHMVINGHNYLYDLLPEDISSDVHYVMMTLLVTAGLTVLVYLMGRHRIKLPEYTEYHKKRTLPVMLSSVPCWMIAVYMIIEMITDFQPMTR